MNTTTEIRICPVSGKKSFLTRAAAEAFEQKNREELPRERQYVYSCRECHDFHLTSNPPQETNSNSYARVQFPNVPETLSLSEQVQARRDKVLMVIHDENKSYDELARDCGIAEDIFKADVQYLRSRGLYAGRIQRTVTVVVPHSKSKHDPAAKLAAARAARAAAEAAEAAAEQEFAAAEAARLEREKLTIDWEITDTGKSIRVTKSGARVLWSVDNWREILQNLSDVLGKYDRGEISFPSYDGASNGTIISGPRTGEIHEDFKR